MAWGGLRKRVFLNIILDELYFLTRKFVVRIVPVIIAVAALLLPGMAGAEDAAAMREARLARWMHAGLLDPEAPIEQRRAIVGELEAIAKDDSERNVLYLLGSLYRQNPADSSSLLRRISTARANCFHARPCTDTCWPWPSFQRSSCSQAITSRPIPEPSSTATTCWTRAVTRLRRTAISPQWS